MNLDFQKNPKDQDLVGFFEGNILEVKYVLCKAE